ncbi:MAG: 16S rRNA (guanine(527)-N(7))-methyltransferase RsmG [Anaerolineales bacterium]|nr:16S rRNA (guanine(527)-N(7))-methyltransferase RsmG [Anaerolineales bacterium]
MKWVEQAQRMGVVLNKEQIEQFKRYAALLLAWNEKLNLTAVRQLDQIYQRHFLDSLSCVSVLGQLDGRSLIDVGSGAGFPGLPLKIVFPQMRLTLVESVQKKARFLEVVAAELQLENVTIVAERVEQIGQQAAHREQYDWAVARAVAELRVLVEYLLPLCRVGGAMLAQKGPQAGAELAAAQQAISQLGGGDAQLHAVSQPEEEMNWYLVVIPKTAVTPPKFPRRVGMPVKRPL